MITKPEGPFIIMINEHQRKLLIRLMEKALSDDDFTLELLAEPDEEGMQDTELEAAKLLLTLTKELPQINEVSDDKSWGANGTIVHGFCL